LYRVNPKPGGAWLRSSQLEGRELASRAEQYWQLAQECQSIASTLPFGSPAQIAVLEMAEEWERLAKEQERATDLGQQ
jgi:hypothetical protein